MMKAECFFVFLRLDVLVHNHPSGAAEPSAADRQLTARLKEAAALFDIRLLDHLILAREGDFSFKRAGLI